MNPNLSHFSAATILTLIIFLLTALLTTDLVDPRPTWTWSFAIMAAINVGFYLFARFGKREKN